MCAEREREREARGETSNRHCVKEHVRGRERKQRSLLVEHYKLEAVHSHTLSKKLMARIVTTQ